MNLDTGLRCALAMADPYNFRPMCHILRHLNITPTIETTSGLEALYQISQTLTDLLLCDLILPTLDGLSLIHRIKTMHIPTMPAVILMSPCNLKIFETQALDEGACAILHRPFDPPELRALVERLTVRDRLQRLSATETTIGRLLAELGFSIRTRGTAYLVEAILLASKDSRLVDELTNDLYPLVAAHFSTTTDRVEHGIRRAIESAWSSGALAMQHKMFGDTIDARRGKPVSGEMIARMADQLRAKEIGN